MKNNIKKNSKVKSKRNTFRFFKRIFDIIFSFIGIIILIPLIVIIKLLFILTGDFGHIFFAQERIGYHGKTFKLLKIRTMYIDADERLNKMLKEDPVLRKEYKKNKKLENDPRITKIGNILRKTSIDELPQLINVFFGKMSIIGNRPYLPREQKDMGKYYSSIVSTKPGLTGLWQVSGRSNTTFQRRLQLEKYYSKNFSLKLDIIIFFKTIKVIFLKEGAK